MPFHNLALDFTEGLDSGTSIEEIQVNIDPVTHYMRVLYITRVVTILFTVHLARCFCWVEFTVVLASSCPS